MKFVETGIPGLQVIEPSVFGDDRGFFLESWNSDAFLKAGLDLNFVQDNHSRSAKGVLRGLHFQNPMPQGKLVRVVHGAVWDVVVDLRQNSPTFAKWFGIELSGANKQMLWVPEGLAHGFLTLTDDTDFLYKCTGPYVPEYEQSLAWDDPTVGIQWPLEGIVPQLSQKDNKGVPLSNAKLFA
jgi:dTDP-4-dehydrorhamnose 3,5-epimerase